MTSAGRGAAALLLAAGAAVAQQPLPPGGPDVAPRSIGPLLARDSAEAAIFRGSVVYANYCVTCHGANADGNGRAARLYTPRPANLRASDKHEAYVLQIIRFGGEAMGRSPFMPPWGAELTDEQMRDVTAYVRAINGTAAAR